MSNKDEIFTQPKERLDPFKFDHQVADVFEDMINRSVPGYSQIIQTLPSIIRPHLKQDSLVYDLGCALGSASLYLAKTLQDLQIRIRAIDSSKDMVEKSINLIGNYRFASNIDVLQADITKLSLEQCDATVMNFTLQFIAPDLRQNVMTKIYQSLSQNGILILSEKISFDDGRINKSLSDLHHDFKRQNGYSELEISQKRSALENVMITDTLQTHVQRLNDAGFSSVSAWFQHFNFVSMIALK